jgi:hypothetical protein
MLTEAGPRLKNSIISNNWSDSYGEKARYPLEELLKTFRF